VNERRGFLLVNAIKLIKNVLPRHLFVRAARTLLYIFCNSLIELIGIAILIPLLIVILNENNINHNPWLKNVYDGLGFSSYAQFIIFICSLVLFFTVLKNLLSVVLVREQYRFSFSVYKHISLALFRKYYSLGLQSLKVHNSNRLVNHITSVTLMFSQNVINSVSGIISEVLILLLFVGGLIIYDPLVVGVVAVLIMPSMFLFFKLVKKRIHEIGIKRNANSIEQNKLLYETFQGYADIEANNKETWVFKRISSLLQQMNALQIRNALFLQLPLRFIEVNIVVCLVAIICFSIWTNKSTEEIGVLLGVIAVAAYRLLPGINRLMNFFITLRNHEYTFDIVAQISAGEEIESTGLNTGADYAEPIRFENDIRLDRICFAFEKKVPILNNVSFTIRKGDIIGIIGSSGSGKSTLLNVLLRFYRETSGVITVDGAVLGAEHTQSWRQLIGYVPQDVFVFDGTLAENIALGVNADAVDLARLARAIEMANLSETVDSWESGIYTSIGEKGSRLSGGQRQRLGIARALYKGAELLLFDEATSALDVKTEEEITNSIQQLAKMNNQLTFLIIAHRYTTLRHCTRIIELTNGRVADELTYPVLYERQSH